MTKKETLALVTAAVFAMGNTAIVIGTVAAFSDDAQAWISQISMPSANASCIAVHTPPPLPECVDITNLSQRCICYPDIGVMPECNC